MATASRSSITVRSNRSTLPSGCTCAQQPLRRPVHRQPADEHDPVGGRDRRAGHWRSGSPAASSRFHPTSRGQSNGPTRGRHHRRAPRAPRDRRAGGVVPATVTVVESLGHERHVICRLEDSTMIIVRQAADDDIRRKRVSASISPQPPSTFMSSTPSTERRLDAEAHECARQRVRTRPRSRDIPPAPTRSRRMRESGLALVMLAPAIVIFASSSSIHSSRTSSSRSIASHRSRTLPSTLCRASTRSGTCSGHESS